MADRIIKPDDTNDLVLQNNDGSAKIEVNEAQTVVLTGGSTTALTIDTDGDIQIANNIDTGTFNGTIGSSATGNWGWKLLQTETISTAVSNKDMGSSALFSSTYDTYKILFNDLALAADNAFYIQLSTSSGYVTSSDYDYTAKGFSSNNDASQSSGTSSGFIRIHAYDAKGGDTTRMGANAEITIPNPALSGVAHFVYGIVSFQNSSNYNVISTFTGGFATNATHQVPITGVRIKGASQNLTRGTIRLYGVANA
jgi:hypothetical protein